jgi:hypothetical protein
VSGLGIFLLIAAVTMLVIQAIMIPGARRLGAD